jgi:transcriptional regulator with XRE-family HTH domain
MGISETIRQAICVATETACPNQATIATAAGVTPLTLSYWRTGRRNPTARNAMELARVLLEHARSVERVAVELMRVAQQEELRHEREAQPAKEEQNLNLFSVEGDAA